MSTTNNTNAPLSLDTPIDEDRVRRALGLKSNGTTHQQRPEQARQRHRFVADGAVPVVMLNRSDSEVSGLRERLGAAETALEHERLAHASTRRALHEAQAANQALQTRFGHNELARNEALATERDARRGAEDTISALRAELAERVAAVRAQSTTEPGHLRKPRTVVIKAAKEQKPVRWWTPSYRSKQR